MYVTEFWFRPNLRLRVFFPWKCYIWFLDENLSLKCMGRFWNSKTKGYFVFLIVFTDSSLNFGLEKWYYTYRWPFPDNDLTCGFCHNRVYGDLNLVLSVNILQYPWPQNFHPSIPSKSKTPKHLYLNIPDLRKSKPSISFNIIDTEHQSIIFPKYPSELSWISLDINGCPWIMSGRYYPWLSLNQNVMGKKQNMWPEYWPVL